MVRTQYDGADFGEHTVNYVTFDAQRDVLYIGQYMALTEHGNHVRGYESKFFFNCCWEYAGNMTQGIRCWESLFFLERLHSIDCSARVNARILGWLPCVAASSFRSVRGDVLVLYVRSCGMESCA